MPKDTTDFDEGKSAGVMKLEDVMDGDSAYSVRELEERTGRTYTRILHKLKELRGVGKAEDRIIDHVTYWRLTTKAYLEGTVKERKRKKKRKPGRPSEWVR